MNRSLAPLTSYLGVKRKMLCQKNLRSLYGRTMQIKYAIGLLSGSKTNLVGQ